MAMNPQETSKPSPEQAATNGKSVSPDQDTVANHSGSTSLRGALIDRAYHEFCENEAAGASIDPEEFCERYPRIRSSLFRRIEVHQLLESNCSILPAEEPEWPRKGETLFQLELIEQIGRGGLSRVFLAEQLDLSRRPVVVKISSIQTAEAGTLAKLHHDNIVPVYATHQDKSRGVSLSVMPYLSRHTLVDFLDEAFVHRVRPRKVSTPLVGLLTAYHNADRLRLGLDELPQPDDAFYLDAVIQLIRQLAGALAHTHARNILHLDIKPSNILLTPAGRPLLMDFNLSAEQRMVHALAGGTLPYMSPEQIRAAGLVEPNGGREVLGRRPGVDARSDIFALGVVFYELVCGKHPYGILSWRRNLPELADELLARQEVGPQPLRRQAGWLDPGLKETIQECLAHDPDERIQTSEQLAERCELLLKPPHRRQRRLRSDRRSQALFVSATTAAVALVVGLTLLLASFMPPPIEEQAEALFARGRAEVQQHAYRDAYAAFQHAAQLERKGVTFAWMGYCKAMDGEYLEAIDAYEEARALEYETPGLLTGLAFCYARPYQYNQTGKRQEMRQAELLVNEAIRRDPSLQEAHLLKAHLWWLLLGDEYLNRTIPHLERAKKLGDLPPLGHLWAATIYLNSQLPEHREAAVEHLDVVLKLGVDPRTLKQAAASRLRNDPELDRLFQNAKLSPPFTRLPPVIPVPVDPRSPRDISLAQDSP